MEYGRGQQAEGVGPQQAAILLRAKGTWLSGSSGAWKMRAEPLISKGETRLASSPAGSHGPTQLHPSGRYSMS